MPVPARPKRSAVPAPPQGRPHQDRGGSHEVLRITSAPAETRSSPFPKMLRPLPGDQRAPEGPTGVALRFKSPAAQPLTSRGAVIGCEGP